jgi:Concanavalin A-like lectin/glucanases superfamily
VSRRGVAAVVLSALVACLLAGAVPRGPAAWADPSPDGTTPADYAAASAQAQAAGSQVEVVGQRSETTQVFANPDGTFTASAASRPVRVHQADGSWADVDPTLRRNADGSVGPVAALGGLRLSGGGNGPLATLDTGGRSLGISWNGTLQPPTLTGDTATYTEVLPGVDLKVRATADGFANTVVVRTAQAAALPAVQSLHFGLSTSGVTAVVAADGSLSAVDAAGQQVFAAPPARMWDSSDGSTTVAGDAEQPVVNRTGYDAVSDSTAPGATARQADATVRLGPDGLTMEPEATLLAHGTFPIYVDPETTFNLTAWSEVNSYKPGSVWRTTDNRPAVGHAYDNFGTYTVRSFFGFNTSAVRGAHIYTAVMRAFLVHSWSCSPRPVELWALPGGVNQRATWNSQPSWATAAGAQFQSRLNVAKGYTGCAAGSIAFNATPGVARAAAARAGSLLLGLKASNESDVYGWKKFEVASPRLVPQLDVTYDFAPNPLAAKDLTTSGLASRCVATAANAPSLKIDAHGITLRAAATDPDGSQNKLRVNFEWARTDTNPPTRIGGAASGLFLPGSNQFTAVLPKQAQDGGYAWRAQVQDINPATGAVMSTTPWSPYCYLNQDTSKPSSPLVDSPQYPGGKRAADQPAGVGRMVQFSIDPNGATDVTRYYWSLGTDRGDSGTPINVSPGAGATLTLTPAEPGPTKLFVLSADSANNHQRDSVLFLFEVPDEMSMPQAAMDFEDPGQDSSGTGRTVTVTNVTTVPGKVGSGGHFDGQSSLAVTDPAVQPYNNFAASAWVRITDPTHTGVVLSLVGTTASGGRLNPFNLAYDGSARQWVAEFPGVSPTPQARSAQPATTDWTFLTATYDAAARKLSLYVNGQLSGTATATISTGAQAGGPLRVYYGGTQGGTNPPVLLLAGDIDQARVWDRMAFGSEVSLLGQWDLDGDGTDTSGYGRNLTFGSAHPTWSGDIFNAPTSSLSMNGGGSQWAATAGPVLRTDASYTVAAWVNLNAKTNPNDPNDPGAMTVVCQLAGRDCPFYLFYRHDLDRWTVDVPNVDSDTPVVGRATSDLSPDAGSWVQLVLVHDAGARTMRLYVGNTAGGPVLQRVQTTVATPFNATGAFNLGRSKWKGAGTNYLNGRIDDVRVWGTALASWEIEKGLAP